MRWHNSIFDYKLRTIEAENPKKVKEQSASTQNLLVLIKTSVVQVQVLSCMFNV